MKNHDDLFFAGPINPRVEARARARSESTLQGMSLRQAYLQLGIAHPAICEGHQAHSGADEPNQPLQARRPAELELHALAESKSESIFAHALSARKQMLEPPDELATKVNIVFYADVRDAFMKGLAE